MCDDWFVYEFVLERIWGFFDFEQVVLRLLNTRRAETMQTPTLPRRLLRTYCTAPYELVYTVSDIRVLLYLPDCLVRLADASIPFSAESNYMI